MSLLIYMILWLSAGMTIVLGVSLIAKKHGYIYLAALFVGCILASQIVASKIIVVGEYALSASIVSYSITFLATDVLSEFWGKEKARKAVWGGLVADLILLLTVYVAIWWPAADFWKSQAAFEETLSSTGRVVLASVLAYISAQHSDVSFFHFWKEKTGGKYLWLRNNLSTMLGQSIDSIVFYTIAFYGSFPIFKLILVTIVAKLFIAAFDTPFIYLVRWLFRNSKSSEFV